MKTYAIILTIHMIGFVTYLLYIKYMIKKQITEKNIMYYNTIWLSTFIVYLILMMSVSIFNIFPFFSVSINITSLIVNSIVLIVLFFVIDIITYKLYKMVI